MRVTSVVKQQKFQMVRLLQKFEMVRFLQGWVRENEMEESEKNLVLSVYDKSMFLI